MSKHILDRPRHLSGRRRAQAFLLIERLLAGGRLAEAARALYRSRRPIAAEPRRVAAYLRIDRRS